MGTFNLIIFLLCLLFEGQVQAFPDVPNKPKKYALSQVLVISDFQFPDQDSTDRALKSGSWHPTKNDASIFWSTDEVDIEKINATVFSYAYTGNGSSLHKRREPIVGPQDINTIDSGKTLQMLGGLGRSMGGALVLSDKPGWYLPPVAKVGQVQMMSNIYIPPGFTSGLIKPSVYSEIIAGHGFITTPGKLDGLFPRPVPEVPSARFHPDRRPPMKLEKMKEWQFLDDWPILPDDDSDIAEGPSKPKPGDKETANKPADTSDGNKGEGSKQHQPEGNEPPKKPTDASDGNKAEGPNKPEVKEPPKKPADTANGDTAGGSKQPPPEHQEPPKKPTDTKGGPNVDDGLKPTPDDKTPSKPKPHGKEPLKNPNGQDPKIPKPDDNTLQNPNSPETNPGFDPYDGKQNSNPKSPSPDTNNGFDPIEGQNPKPNEKNPNIPKPGDGDAKAPMPKDKLPNPSPEMGSSKNPPYVDSGTGMQDYEDMGTQTSDIDKGKAPKPGSKAEGKRPVPPDNGGGVNQAAKTEPDAKDYAEHDFFEEYKARQESVQKANAAKNRKVAEAEAAQKRLDAAEKARKQAEAEKQAIERAGKKADAAEKARVEKELKEKYTKELREKEILEKEVIEKQRLEKELFEQERLEREELTKKLNEKPKPNEKHSPNDNLKPSDQETQVPKPDDKPPKPKPNNQKPNMPNDKPQDLPVKDSNPSSQNLDKVPHSPDKPPPQDPKPPSQNVDKGPKIKPKADEDRIAREFEEFERKQRFEEGKKKLADQASGKETKPPRPEKPPPKKLSPDRFPAEEAKTVPVDKKIGPDSGAGSDKLRAPEKVNSGAPVEQLSGDPQVTKPKKPNAFEENRARLKELLEGHRTEGAPVEKPGQSAPNKSPLEQPHADLNPVSPDKAPGSEGLPSKQPAVEPQGGTSNANTKPLDDVPGSDKANSGLTTKPGPGEVSGVKPAALDSKPLGTSPSPGTSGNSEMNSLMKEITDLQEEYKGLGGDPNDLAVHRPGSPMGTDPDLVPKPLNPRPKPVAQAPDPLPALDPDVPYDINPDIDWNEDIWNQKTPHENITPPQSPGNAGGHRADSVVGPPLDAQKNAGSVPPNPGGSAAKPADAAANLGKPGGASNLNQGTTPANNFAKDGSAALQSSRHNPVKGPVDPNSGRGMGAKIADAAPGPSNSGARVKWPKVEANGGLGRVITQADVNDLASGHNIDAPKQAAHGITKGTGPSGPDMLDTLDGAADAKPPSAAELKSMGIGDMDHPPEELMEMGEEMTDVIDGQVDDIVKGSKGTAKKFWSKAKKPIQNVSGGWDQVKRGWNKTWEMLLKPLDIWWKYVCKKWEMIGKAIKSIFNISEKVVSGWGKFGRGFSKLITGIKASRVWVKFVKYGTMAAKWAKIWGPTVLKMSGKWAGKISSAVGWITLIWDIKDAAELIHCLATAADRVGPPPSHCDGEITKLITSWVVEKTHQVAES